MSERPRKVEGLTGAAPRARFSDVSCLHPEAKATIAAFVMVPQFLRLSDVSCLQPELATAASVIK